MDSMKALTSGVRAYRYVKAGQARLAVHVPAGVGVFDCDVEQARVLCRELLELVDRPVPEQSSCGDVGRKVVEVTDRMVDIATGRAETRSFEELRRSSAFGRTA